MKSRLPRGYHKWFGKTIRFLGEFFIRYQMAYQFGYVEGMKKSNYFKGMADGQEEMHKWYQDNAIFELKRKKNTNK